MRRPSSALALGSLSGLLILTVTGTMGRIAVRSMTSGPPIQLSREEYYLNARPYLDYSLQDLARQVPELRGIEPADSQDRLPLLLYKLGDHLQGFLDQIPDLIADEEVVRTPSASELWRLRDPHAQLFSYLILPRRTDQKVTLEEYRTDRSGRDLRPGSAYRRTPLAQGFALMWVPFHPYARSESRFRYLGRQKIKGLETSVVAFAQKPGKVQSPGEVHIQGKPIVILSQGVAWINESDFQIVRLRTDLLAPRPDVGLERLTTDLSFGEVRIAGTRSALRLPTRVTVITGYENGTLKETHSYSHYRLFKVQTRIRTIPP